MLDYHLRQSQKYIKKSKGGQASWKLVPLLCLGLALIVLAYFCFSLMFRSSKRDDIGQEDYIVFLPVQEEGNVPAIVQEIICPKGAQLCFKVEDYVVDDGAGHRSAKYQRRMMVETVDEIVLSVADLVPNAGEHFSAQNAAKWSVLKTRLVLPYTKGIVAQMFATDCIQLDSPKPMRTLMIGLGGGVIPNFLGELEGNHEIVSIELEPAAEYIAHKWFSLEKSGKQRVIIQDGLEYVNSWQPSTGKFDCIIVDACANTLESGSKAEGKNPLICPLADFVNNERIVKNMFAMLKATGTLLINTFVIENWSNEEEVSEERQFILELFRHHFGNCYYAHMVHNKILVCSLSMTKSEPMTDQLYKKRIKALPNWLQNELHTSVKIVNQIWKPKRPEM